VSERVHGSCVAWPQGAVLLRGASGAGKSDLALRLLDLGAELVADDQVLLKRNGARVLAEPPPSLAGLLEVRGVGILAVGHRAPAPVILVIDLVPDELVERLPEPHREELLGIALPLLRLSPWPASAAGKVRLAVKLASGSIMPAS
jgi:HPr kinase/phosphorylase